MAEDQKFITELDSTNVGVRQNLVDTAVNFLLNVDILKKPEETKVAFLKNKGLNDAEISLAFERARSDPRCNTITIPNVPPLPYPQRTYSFWSQLSRISSSLIVVAVALYGLHRFYKLYIEPWLFGSKCEKSRLQLMEEQLFELNTSIVQLSSTVSTLEKSINSHKQQIDSMIEASGIVSTSVAVSSLKTEIGNVKSLLINRHQFPAVPKVASPSIPHWQLHSAENENSENESIPEKEDNLEDDLSMKTEYDQSTGNPSSESVSAENKRKENGVASGDESSNHKNESEHNDDEKV